MDLRRALLFFALAFVLMLLYQRWVEEQTPEPSQPAAAPLQAPAQSAGGDTPGGPTTPDIPSAPAVAAPDAPNAPDVPSVNMIPDQRQSGSDRWITVTTDLLRVQIDRTGGQIKRVDLLEYPISVDKPDEPITLMNDDPYNVFVEQSGLIGRDREYPNHKVTYAVTSSSFELGDSAEPLIVPLQWTAPDGVVYTKEFVFKRDSYLIDIVYRVDNRSTESWTGFLYAQFLRNEVYLERGFFLDVVPSYLGGSIYTPTERFEKIDFGDMRERNLNRASDEGWVAMLQHYFVAALIPKVPGPYTFYSKTYGTGAAERFNLGFNTNTPVTVAPSSTGSMSLSLFVGPKEQERLEEVAEGLVLTVDYGWLTPISAPLFWILEKIYALVGNWGWAIVLLTLFIKLAFYPLSAASYKSMAKMKKMAPRLQTLKERYGDDRAKLNQAMMEMYKKDKVNPLGGCLPILVQIPVFIALYWVLLESVELRQAPFAFWIKDLSIKDPYFILPIAMGATMVAQQFLNPAPLDPVQKKIMMAMPIVFTFLFLYFPAGLVLYWLVNNVLSIAQQWYVNRSINV